MRIEEAETPDVRVEHKTYLQNKTETPTPRRSLFVSGCVLYCEAHAGAFLGRFISRDFGGRVGWLRIGRRIRRLEFLRLGLCHRWGWCSGAFWFRG